MRFLLLALAAAVLAGCGSDGSDAGGGTADPLSVEQALSSDQQGEIVVEGILFAEGESVRLCDAIAESYPPQCGGASIRVEGLQLDDVHGLATEGDMSWTEHAIRVLGVVAGETLAVRENAQP
jgi:hypothetical protein